ncbi:MAG: HK97 family phage prohead protease [Hyphomicrobiaceae bacterium]|nr:HK97 family phage prohead protease [Hyphomicrobiaceae bacterium]
MNLCHQQPGGERKFAPLDFKAVQTDGSFEGYASLFGQKDMGGDIVMPGAFAKSLKKRGAGGIRMLFQHDPGEPIGVWREIREDQRGLFVRGQLLPDVARAREVLSLMREGALDGLSIGFRTLKGRSDKARKVRRLHEIDLWEISIVTFPMLPNARISKVKSGSLPTIREFERWLVRDAGLTRQNARAVIRSGYQNLVVKQDAAGNETGQLVSAMRRAAQMMKSD